MCDKYQNLLRQAIERRNSCKSACEFYSMCMGGCNNNALINGDITKSNFSECIIRKTLLKEIFKRLESFDVHAAININPTIRQCFN